jgi:hypothetical protein
VAEPTYGQLIVVSLASGLVGGLIGAGASFSVAWLTGKQSRDAASASRQAEVQSRSEERRSADLRAFQDSVESWSLAWTTQLTAWKDHAPQDPPNPSTFVSLLAAQSALRTAAARIGDRGLIDELLAVADMTTEVAIAPNLASKPGERAGDMTSRLVYGTALMADQHLSWNEVQARWGLNH